MPEVEGKIPSTENIRVQQTEMVSAPPENKNSILKILTVVAVVIVLIGYFILKQSSVVKPPKQDGKTSLSKQAPPITINETSPSAMFIDIKNQLIKTFK